MENYNEFKDFSNNCDLFFTIFFAVEAFIKALAYGFCLNKNSYLRDSWS